jgi:hypothetical protein
MFRGRPAVTSHFNSPLRLQKTEQCQCGSSITLRELVEFVHGDSGGGIQYVEHTEGDGVEMFKAICKLGLEGIVAKKLDAPYKSGPSKAWLKIKNPKSPAATRVIDGTS